MCEQKEIRLNQKEAVDCKRFNGLSQVIPFKWRINTTKSAYGDNKPQGIFQAYIENYEIRNLLDSCFGAWNWKNEYYSLNDSIYCKIELFSETRNEWIAKSDSGESKRDFLKETYLLSNSEEKKKLLKELENASKKEATDAFKRASLRFGIGGFVKKIGSVSVNLSDDYKFILTGIYTKNNNEIKIYKTETDRLSDYINSICPIPKELEIEIKNCTSKEHLEGIKKRMYNLSKNKLFTQLCNDKKF